MIKVVDVRKIYNEGQANVFEALCGLSLQVNEGEMVAIMGRSGSGKSTLLHVLACIDSYESGEYYLDNTLIKNLSEKQFTKIRNEKIGIVIQDFALIEEFSALDNVLLPLNFAKPKKRNRIDIAYEALEELDIIDLADQPISKMSGGQKQRVAIARAIVNNPSVILADEPTGALDSQTAEKIMDIFKQLHQKGKTIIIVTHDKEIADQCDRIVELKDGRI